MIAPDKILLIRPDRLGDLILSLPVAETIKRNRPESCVYYLVSPYTSPVAPMVKYVDGWLLDGEKDGKRLSFSKLAGIIRNRRFDCIIELKPSWRTAAAGFFSGAKTRIGTSRRFYSFYYSDRLSIHRRSSGYHQTDLELRHLDLFDYRERATQPNINATDYGLSRAEKLLGLNHKPYIVIHPGSSGSAPNWPVEHYRELAVMIREKLKFGVVVTDSKPGLRGFDGCIDLGGKTDLESLAGVLARAEVFVSGSTGPLHLADALGIPCVSFFVDRSDIGPERWGPRRNLENVLLPPEHCDCSDLRKCRCLVNIPPLEAFEKIVKIINTAKTAGVKEN